MSALPPIPDANGPPGGVLQNLGPIGPARAFRRGRDDGVDLFGIQGALDHQRLCNRQNRRAMLQDQGFRLGEAERQIGINSGFACADDRRQRAGLPDVAMRDPWRVVGMQKRFRRSPSAEIDDANMHMCEDFGGVDPGFAGAGHRRGDVPADIGHEGVIGARPRGLSVARAGMQQIAQWLEEIGLSEYAQRFAENGIDSSVVRHLTEQDLKDIGVLLGHRRKMLAAISNLTDATAVTPSALEVQPVEIRDPSGFTAAFTAMKVGSPQALIALSEPLTFYHVKEIAELAAEQRLPSAYGFREYCDAGGLLCYGANFSSQVRRYSYFIDKILKGAKPGHSDRRAHKPRTDRQWPGGKIARPNPPTVHPDQRRQVDRISQRPFPILAFVKSAAMRRLRSRIIAAISRHGPHVLSNEHDGICRHVALWHL
jgi:hypothetical protein